MTRDAGNTAISRMPDQAQQLTRFARQQRQPMRTTRLTIVSVPPAARQHFNRHIHCRLGDAFELSQHLTQPARMRRRHREQPLLSDGVVAYDNFGTDGGLDCLKHYMH